MQSLVRKAIEKKKVISFEYEGVLVIGEPHAIGYCSGDKALQMLLRHTGGPSDKPLGVWKMFEVKKMSKFIKRNESFFPALKGNNKMNFNVFSEILEEAK